jgi:hypothetical protein
MMDFAFFDTLARPRTLFLTLLPIGVVFVLLAAYHGVGLGRDNIYVTKPIHNTELYVTVPQLTHIGDKIYQLFIHTDAGNATPAATSTAALRATTIISVTSATGVLLLPEQPLSFTFAPAYYQSANISYTHNLTPNVLTHFFGSPPARLSITTSTGQSGEFTLARESFFLMALRKMLIESLSGIILTTVLPTLLILLSRATVFRKAVLKQRFQALERAVAQEAGEAAAFSDRRQLNRLDEELAVLRERKWDLDEEPRQRLDCIANSLTACRALSALHQRDYSEASRLIAALDNTDCFLDERQKGTIRFLLQVPHQKHIPAELIGPTMPFLNERLLWLQHNGLLDKLPPAMIDPLVKAHDEASVVIDSAIVERFRKLKQLSDWEPPPRVREQNDDVQLEPLGLRVRYCGVEAPIDEYVKLEPGNQTVIVVGPRGSGKTTTLAFLQNHLRQPGALYLPPVAAGSLQGEKLLPTLALQLVQALIQLLPKNAGLWPFLLEDFQAQNTIIDQLLKRLSVESLPDQARTVVLLVALSEILTKLKIESLCLAIDDAAPDFDYAGVRRVIQGYVPKQIYLRIAMPQAEAPPGFRTVITLSWREESLKELLDAIKEGDQRWVPSWKGPASELQFWAALREPRSLLVWLVALRAYSQGEDIADEAWERLYRTMTAARSRRDPQATDWLMEDWIEARRSLGVR